MSIAVYILVMASVTYLIRMLPFTFFTKKIESKFLRSFLYYVPYAVLSAMTFPAVFHVTGSTVSSSVGAAAALILAFLDLPLIAVAAAAAAAAFAAGQIF